MDSVDEILSFQSPKVAPDGRGADLKSPRKIRYADDSTLGNEFTDRLPSLRAQHWVHNPPSSITLIVANHAFLSTISCSSAHHRA
jgi:hypothetical protein